MKRRGTIPPAESHRLRAAAQSCETAASRLRAAVVGAAAAGGSVRRIAAELGRDKNTIQSWLMEERKRGLD